jgi:hypothetical protein
MYNEIIICWYIEPLIVLIFMKLVHVAHAIPEYPVPLRYGFIR